jgi:hypothetical protein
MSKIAPGQLLTITGAADVLTLIQQNLEIITAQIYKQIATHQNGAPTDIIGPPTSGERIQHELWRDALGALWLCTAPGEPGDWLQIAPAVTEGEPDSGSIPAAYQILDASAAHRRKTHAGAYVWEYVHDPAGTAAAAAAAVSGDLTAHEGDTANPHGVTKAQVGLGDVTNDAQLPKAGGSFDDGANIVTGTGTGTQIGTAANQKLGLWGAAPIVQPAGAAQAAVVLGNVDNAIGALTISDPPTQAEVQALRDECETLADDVRALSALIHAIRTAGVDTGSIKGSA